MKERTYFGSVYVADRMLGEYFIPVLKSFSKFGIEVKDGGILISGTNHSFLKDGVSWACWVHSNGILYFEKGRLDWFRKPLIEHISFFGVTCVVSEMMPLLLEIGEELSAIEDRLGSKISKVLAGKGSSIG